jgi:hypothetical protein
MSKWRYDEKVDKRNYIQEAKELVNSLRGSQIYDMYSIVHKQLQNSVSPTREKELQAVKIVIENYPYIDSRRLDFALNGYKTEMAQNGHPKDGVKTNHRKKV